MRPTVSGVPGEEGTVHPTLPGVHGEEGEWVDTALGPRRGGDSAVDTARGPRRVGDSVADTSLCRKEEGTMHPTVPRVLRGGDSWGQHYPRSQERR